MIKLNIKLIVVIKIDVVWNLLNLLVKIKTMVRISTCLIIRHAQYIQTQVHKHTHTHIHPYINEYE